MKETMKSVLTPFDTSKFPELQIPPFDFKQDRMSALIKDTFSKREDQVLQKLKEHGFEFSNKIELAQFIKTRCELESYTNKLRILRVDGQPVMEWWETSRFENNGTTITCIIGEPPA